MNRILLLIIVAQLSIGAYAQWRVGATLGGDYNFYSRSNHYMEDFHYTGAWGVEAGIMGQYIVKDWLGIRIDLCWIHKNHRQYRAQIESDYRTINQYFLLPIMASFSLGNTKWRGFVNVGGYGAYWNSSKMVGTISVLNSTVKEFREDVTFDSKRDQRWDYGVAAGAGVDCISEHTGEHN